MSKIIYDVYQNKNAHNAAYGKYFGRIVHTETLNTRKLARHIADHGSVYTQDVVEGVLTKAEACIVEMLLESKKIKLEGLGTFYLMAQNKKGGAVSIDKFNPKSSFKGLHIRFLPDLSDEAGLNSKDVLAKATFMWAEDLKREKAESRPTNPTNGGESGGGSSAGSDSGNGGSEQGGNGGSEQGGNQSQATTYALTITKSGTGTASVKNDSEETINSGDSLASGANVYIAVTPATGQIPTATLNGESVSLSENDGEYVGTFQMPAQASSLVINSGSVSGGSADQN
jgi:predicted histone-like DNA-binding protein